MSAGMFGQVNQLGGFAHAQDRGLGHRVRLSRKSDDAAVVIGVHFVAKNKNSWDGAHGPDYRVHFGRVTAFGKIGDAFNESFHQD
jgi:hypothetical protein